MTLDEARNLIGRQVVYTPYTDARVEQGVIASVNSAWVFVRYDGDQHAKATHPDMLNLAVGGV